MFSPGNEESWNMRIQIVSVGEKMNLNQKTPRVDKRISGLEGGYGYGASSDQESEAKNESRGRSVGGELASSEQHKKT